MRLPKGVRRHYPATVSTNHLCALPEAMKFYHTIHKCRYWTWQRKLWQPRPIELQTAGV